MLAYLPHIVFTAAALLALGSIHASLRDYLPKARQIVRLRASIALQSAWQGRQSPRAQIRRAPLDCGAAYPFPLRQWGKR